VFLRMRTLIVFCTLMMTASPALAWWDAGHKIAASIAYRQLTQPQRDKVVDLLRAHPRWNDDFAGKMPDDVRTADALVQGEWIFQQASVWADLARDFPPDAKAVYHHQLWHYVDFPQYLNTDDKAAIAITVNLETMPPAQPSDEMNVVQAIALTRSIAGDDSASPAQRAVMLGWVFHLVGDIHQPLHSTALFSRGLFPEGCHGGNLVKVKQRRNMHALWDSLPGEKIEWREARNRSLELLTHAELKQCAEEAAKILDGKAWTDESHALVKSVVYDAEVLAVLKAAESAGERQPPVIDLSEDYLKAAGAVAKQRVVQAGYRLGAVLAEIVE